MDCKHINGGHAGEAENKTQTEGACCDAGEGHGAIGEKGGI